MDAVSSRWSDLTSQLGVETSECWDAIHRNVSLPLIKKSKSHSNPRRRRSECQRVEAQVEVPTLGWRLKVLSVVRVPLLRPVGNCIVFWSTSFHGFCLRDWDDHPMIKCERWAIITFNEWKKHEVSQSLPILSRSHFVISCDFCFLSSCHPPSVIHWDSWQVDALIPPAIQLTFKAIGAIVC